MNEKSIVWKIFHSLWVLVAILPLFGGFAFVYIGLRADERKWLYEGIIYLIPFFLAIILGSNQTIENYAIWFSILFWFVAIIRSLMLIKPYLGRISSKSFHNQGIRNDDNKSGDYYSMFGTEANVNNNQRINDLNDGNDSNIFEINKASVDEISKLPGFDRELARKVMELRVSGIYLDSLDDMSQKLNLSPEQVGLLKSYFNYDDKNEKNSSNQRRLDL